MSIEFDKRVQVNKIIESQLPEFVVADFPLATDFLKQYYISQEYQGGATDLIDNLDRYLKVDNLVPEVITGTTNLPADISASDTTITVASTKGFPSSYGLIKIDDEIISYTGKTDTTFTGCIRGFSGVSGYNVGISSSLLDVNRESLVFNETNALSHNINSIVTNLSVLFLQEFYKKIKRTFLPGLEDETFHPGIDVGNFIKNARSFYQSKGIQESIIILFKLLYGVDAKVLDLEERLVKPSTAEFIRREIVVAEAISGDPYNLVGQTIFKSNDTGTNASVSEVEIITREGKTYYQLSLFVGFDDRDTIQGTFSIQAKTKVLESVSVGSSIISVDSTIGFGNTGSLIAKDQNNVITYTNKSINQFFGCSNILTTIDQGNGIRTSENVYGYENGDISKKCEIRITGVLSKFVAGEDISLVSEREEISIKNVGEVILNTPETTQSYKEVFANSWIYNTSSRYQVSSIQSGQTSFTLLSTIDKSSLKVGDNVSFLRRGTMSVVGGGIIKRIDSSNVITLDGVSFITGEPNSGAKYDLRRNLNKVKTTDSVTIPGTSIGIGASNSVILSDILNVYVDGKKDGYVASNSLPSRTLKLEQFVSELHYPLSGISPIQDDQVGTASTNATQIDPISGLEYDFSAFKLATPTKFITGNDVIYQVRDSAGNDGIPFNGLDDGETYYVSIAEGSDRKTISLYNSISAVGSASSVTWNDPVGAGGTHVHSFILKDHYQRQLYENRILRKFPLSQDLSVTTEKDVPVNDIGVLIDGVQIRSTIANETMSYGPVSSIDVYNSGTGYDVANPPKLSIEAPLDSDGTIAYAEPIISGTVKEVLVDEQNFDIDRVLSVSLTGGNGKDCLLEPITGPRFREIQFDSRDIFFSGGLDIQEETITFKSDHNLVDGQKVFYNSNGQDSVGITKFKEVSNVVTEFLVNGAPYFIKVINPKRVFLFKTEADAMFGVTGINTIGFSTATSAAGFHKFRTESKNTLRKVKVLNSGYDFQYRKLPVNPSGISTSFDSVNFNNHGFGDGDLVEYSTMVGIGSTQPKAIQGLDTTHSYNVIKLNDNSFRLADAGIGGTSTVNYERGNYVGLNSTGTGYQVFKYPDIKIDAKVSFASSVTGSFTFTPIVTGEITGAYLYDQGSKYGSKISGHYFNPQVTIQNGRTAEVKPIIEGGKIVDAFVVNKGKEYFSLPELSVVGSGTTGSGVQLKPVINELGQLDDIIVINPGIGYSTNTSIFVESRGKNGLLNAKIRKLSIDNYQWQGIDHLENLNNDLLQYSIHAYDQDIAESFNDIGGVTNAGVGTHSALIGWAYDGNPIYGPFAYKDPNDINSGIKRMESSFVNNTSYSDRPSVGEYPSKFFIEDNVYDGSGDLDIHNGRFGKTPEFPDGVYAYFATRDANDNPVYPYFVGPTYRLPYIEENTTLDQSFDFNNSNLSRNTLPYKVNEEFADNDFIIESNETIKQKSIVESVTRGVVDTFQILDGGDGYKVGDFTVFDDDGTNGVGARGQVDEIVGIGVSSINTELTSFDKAVFVWESADTVTAHHLPNIELNDQDTVLISGLSTANYKLNNSFTVGVSTDVIGLAKTMSLNNNSAGITEDIYVNYIPNTVSIGGSLRVGDEVLKVLNLYKIGSIIRAFRPSSGIAHTLGSQIDVLNTKISIPVKTTPFNSDLNLIEHFNGTLSVGIGTTSGSVIDYAIGESTKSINVPPQSIYLPSHPFKGGEKVTFTKRPAKSSFLVGRTVDAANQFYIPDQTTSTIDLYIVDKGTDYIGLATNVGAANTEGGLFFFGNGDDDYQYQLETNFTQLTGNIDRIVSTVTTKIGAANTTTHGLQNGDRVSLNVVPNTTVGLGTTSPLVLDYNEQYQKLLINTVGFESPDVDIVTNSITITDHGYKTGDKVFYDSTEVATGLTTGCYYIHVLDSNKFNLSETYTDTFLTPPLFVNITGIGGNYHKLSLVNPKIDVVKNSKLTFGVGSTNLAGYNLKFFYDHEFKNEFVTAGDLNEFNVSGIGTIGVGTFLSSPVVGAAVSIGFSTAVPAILYYALEKGGYISTSDKDVKNYSKIVFTDSKYSGEYNIFDSTTETFKFSPRSIPEVLKYEEDQCDKLEYSSKSGNVEGPIKNIRLISEGSSYKKVPKFLSVNSVSGSNANIVAISTSIGRINDLRIVDVGYEYSSDRTLRPEAFISPVVRIDDLDFIDSVSVVDTGTDYLNAPDLVLINPETGEVVDDTSLEALVPNQGVAGVSVIAPIKGLESITHRVIAINNSNGIGINSMTVINNTTARCVMETPINGYTQAPFAIDDEIFVEGIQLFGESGIGTQTSSNTGISTDGDGWNSSNHGYQFFKVKSYISANPDILEFDLAGITTNPGIAKTYQSGYANVINRNKYPVFAPVQGRSKFSINEPLLVKEGQTNTFQSKDLKAIDIREDFIKTSGLHVLKIGDRIAGEFSGVTATVTGIVANSAKFDVDFSNRREIGWNDNTGLLNEDFQVLPNNDYYQNLSYSVRSSKAWDDFVDPLNRVIHPAGLKNFADTLVETNVDVRVGLGSTEPSSAVVILDVFGERRVDTINDFDLVIDYDARDNKSKFIDFKNRKLTDFTKCKTNRVLIHDDISDKFSSKGSQDGFTEIEEISSRFSKYTIQVVDADTFDVQINDIVTLTTTSDVFLLERTSDYTNQVLGSFDTKIDRFNRKTLEFSPIEKFEKDFDIKVVKTSFNTDTISDGIKEIGCVDLVGKNVAVSAAQTAMSGNNVIVTGTTTTNILQFSDTDFNGFFANVLVRDDASGEIDYNEVIVNFDGTDTYISESYTDVLGVTYSSSSNSKVGVLTARYDSGTIFFDCINDRSSKLVVSANVVGLGTTTAGIGTFRYQVPGQPDGSERTARFESNYVTTNNGTSATITTIDRNVDSSIKALVRVSCGQTSAIHQALLIQDQNDDAISIQYPHVSIDDISGIGTFGTVTDITNQKVRLEFYPDSKYNSGLVEIQAFTEIFQTVNDFENEPSALQFGPVSSEVIVSSYDGINGTRGNRINFDIKHEGTPVYFKKFNPSNTTQVINSTGAGTTFSIPSHFFNTNEVLSYKAASTFIGVSPVSVGIAQTADNDGNLVTIMPPTVFVKALTPDSFQLFTKKEYIADGKPIEVTNVGSGNAHKLEMSNKLSKTVIGLDGIIQQPITYTSIKHTLSNDIGIGLSQFSLSGISSVQPRDVLKIDDEYMKVVEVGFATETGATINSFNGTIPEVKVIRGSLGVSAGVHTATTSVQVHRGSFNIVDSTLWFLDPPKGNTRTRRDATNLPYVKAEFSGRTFLRTNYDTNMVFDDISDSFTGIGRTYSLTVGGANTSTGVGVGNGILFINGVFQTPLTLNNLGNNYEIEADTVSGVSSVTFTGISSENGQLIQSEFDINQNQVPRGGLIVSMGSTTGVGYAPLVGARVYPKMTNSAISSIVGMGMSVGPIGSGIETANYDNNTGIITVTTNKVHGFGLGSPDTVKLEDFEFICPTNAVGTPVTGTTYDPATGDMVITIAGHGLSNGDAVKLEKESITFSCGYGGATGAAAEKAYPRETDPAYDRYMYVSDVTTDTFKVNVLFGVTPTNTDAHTFVSATTNAVRTIGGGGYVGVTTTIFQDHERPLQLVGIVSERSFEVNVGITSIPHVYVKGGSVWRYENELTFGSGYREPVSIGVTDIAYIHNFVSAATDSVTAYTGSFMGQNLTPTDADYDSVTGAFLMTVPDHGIPGPVDLTVNSAEYDANVGILTASAGTKFDVSDATYNPTTGIIVLTIGTHTLTTNDKLRIEANSLTFSCGYNGATGSAAQKTYPRATGTGVNAGTPDPGYNTFLDITAVDTVAGTVAVKVLSTTPSTNVDPHTFVSATAGAVFAPRVFTNNEQVYFEQNSITFKCAMDNNSTTHTYPRESDPSNGKWLLVSNATSTEFEVNVGTSPLVSHTPVSGTTYDPNTGLMTLEIGAHSLTAGTSVKLEEESITFSCGYNGATGAAAQKAYPRSNGNDPYYNTAITIESVTATTITLKVLNTVPSTNTDPHTFVSATAGAVKSGGYYAHVFDSATSNGAKATKSLKIATESMVFTCSKDDYMSNHPYPRQVAGDGNADPAYDTFLPIVSTTLDTISTNVGSGGGAGKGAIVTAKIASNTHKFVNSIGTHIYKSSISNAVTIGSTKKDVTNAAYTPSTGVLVLTIGAHTFSTSDTVTIAPKALNFTCDADNHATEHAYPRTTDPAYNTALAITAVDQSGGTITCNVGIPYQYEGITADVGGPFTADTVDYDPQCGIMTVTTSAAHGFTAAAVRNTTNAVYNPNVGILTVTTNVNHGFSNGDYIKIAENSLIFSCAKDGFISEHSYPRKGDPLFNRWVQVSNITAKKFEVQSLVNIPSTNVSDHSYERSIAANIMGANNTVQIAAGSLTLTCNKDRHATNHSYPRTTDPVYNRPVGIEAVESTTKFSIDVGRSPYGTGGSLEFTIENGGSGYVNPEIVIPEPNYENVPVKGVSRLGIGKTTTTGVNLLLNLTVGAAQTSVGISSSLFEISKFDIARPGHSFKVGDKFTPLGLVTSAEVEEPLKDFELEVIEIFNDYFSSWQFGEIDFIDTIRDLQNGIRKRFPLFFNGQLLSFEKDETDPLSADINLNAVLLIFVNGVLQTPGTAYQFEGGTTFTFTESPGAGDKVDIFFYLGQRGIDVELIDIQETIKPGDDVRIYRHPALPNSISQDRERVVKEILSSDLIETDIYTGQGINEDDDKPLSWTKQKIDKVIAGELVTKARESLEPCVYPTAKIIGDVSTTSGVGIGLQDGIFVDDAEFFFYEEGPLRIPSSERYGITVDAVDALMLPASGAESPAGASVTAMLNTVSMASTTIPQEQVTSITITDGGSGYTTAPTIKLSAPPIIGVGIGTTATATTTITNGSVTSVTITNPGLYQGGIPNVIIERPAYKPEKIELFKFAQGFTGIITGISTSAGTNNNPVAVKFFFKTVDGNQAGDLRVGYPIAIKDTKIGDGVTSIDSHDTSLIGIGTQFLDNIYKVHAITTADKTGEITCNILSTTNTVGMASTGQYNQTDIGITTSLGTISWGRLYGADTVRAANPISIGVTGLTIDSGLSTFPVLQRRNYSLGSLKGLRNTGAIRLQV